MGGNFEIGDVVVCVHKGTYASSYTRQPPKECAPVYRAFYRVHGVGEEYGLSWVRLDGMKHRWGSEYFRKIDAPRTEIADRIRACKPADHRVPA